jgi:hypothetical protein
MSIVCIKIGENEPSTYAKFGKLSKHLDIIDVLPRKRDKDGKLISRTMGVQGDKEYLGIDVDMDFLTDEEFEEVRRLLVEGVTDKKRLHGVDLSVLNLPKETLAVIDDCAEKRRKKIAYDLTLINREHYKTKIPMTTLLSAAVDKVERKTLAVKLDIAVKGVKVALQDSRTAKALSWQR